jgi:uncharacterized membrane protein (UPF0127 family)
MAQLVRVSNSQVLIPKLQIADSMITRLRGLLGTTELRADQALWIHQCNSVHTFFMKYAIDCVFLDRDMFVTSIKHDVKPGRIVWPQWGAKTVVEMKAGVAAQIFGLQKGEKLHVGT